LWKSRRRIILPMAQSTAAAVAVRLLQILSRDELAQLATSLGLADAKATQVAEALADLPRYEIARVALQAANSTIQMLKEIFQALAHLGVSVRTTGFVFVLADPIDLGPRCELEFSSQAIGNVCDWRTDRDWGSLKDSLTGLKSRWTRFHSGFARILNEARPDERRGRIDLVKSAIRNREVRKPADKARNEGAERILRFVMSRVNEMSSRIPQAARGAMPPEIQWILRDADEFVRKAERVLPRDVARWEKTEPTRYELRPYDGFLRDFDKTREDFNLLADMTEGEHLLDMLRLDVWSSRPQLFEVWTLLTILQWLARRGYHVQLLKLHESVATVRWQLAYAKESEPCAAIMGSRTGQLPTGYLFYQLYRRSGDMPDLALLSGPEPDSQAIWTVDPKHSEKARYSIKHYRRTAVRYRDSFGAPLSIVVEYFRRSDCDANPVDFGDGALLIHECSPGRPGLKFLLDELSHLHPSQATSLVCIDVSQSFASNLDSVLPRIQSYIEKREEGFLDEVLWFAGNAARRKGLRSALASCGPYIASSVGLEDGTKAGPLLEAIARVIQDTGITHVLLVTDGGFDVPFDSLIQQLRKMDLHVDFISANSSEGGV